MFERFTQAGIAIAGIDVGESYGSPDGRALYSALLRRTHPAPRLRAKSRPARTQPRRIDDARLGGGECGQGRGVRGHLSGLQPCQLSRCDEGRGCLPHDRRATRDPPDGAQSHRPARRAGQSGRAAVRHPWRHRPDAFRSKRTPEKCANATKPSAARCNSSSRPARDTTCGPDSSNVRNWWTLFIAQVERTHITLSSPRDYQVVQRTPAGQGQHCHRRRARWVRCQSDHAGGADRRRWEEWRMAETCGDHFSSRHFKPRWSFRRAVGIAWKCGLLSGDKVLAETAVEHVGVGEVFVVAGQSNSANHGEEKQTTKTGKVATFDGKRWQLANDPQPGASGGGGQFSAALWRCDGAALQRAGGHHRLRHWRDQRARVAAEGNKIPESAHAHRSRAAASDAANGKAKARLSTCSSRA